MTAKLGHVRGRLSLHLYDRFVSYVIIGDETIIYETRRYCYIFCDSSAKLLSRQY